MTDLPDVKLKALVSFPANIVDGAGIDVTKTNGRFKFDLAYDDFTPPVMGVPDAAHQNVLLWNDTTHVFVLAPITVVGAGGGVPEAPNDGTQYGRQSLNWTPVATGSSVSPSNTSPIMDGTAAPGTSLLYTRSDHVHPSDTTKIGEAPLDGQAYNRRSSAWAVATAGVTPSNVNPIVDGSATPGVSALYSRGDHVHPTDSTRQAADTDLTAVAALSGIGIARRTSSAPSWSVGDTVVNGELNVMPAFTLKGNNFGGLASPTDVDIASLVSKTSPSGGDYVLLSDQAASGAWKKLPVANFPGASGGISEAPNDGQQYGRQSLGWTLLSGGGVSPSGALPIMDSAANAGISALYSRGDHVHPSDTTRQPLDTELTALASVSSAANMVPYFTGVGTAGTTSFTAFARTLVDDVDASTARGTLGLTGAAISTPAALTKTDDTNVTLTLGGTPATALLQASSITAGWSGTLATTRGGWGLDISASSGVPVFTAGAPTFTGIATAAEYISNSAPTKILTPGAPWSAAAPVALSGASATPNLNAGIDFIWTMSSATSTLVNPTGPKPGQKGMIYLVQDATGNRAITTWGSFYKFPGGIKPTLSTAANAIDVISFAVKSSTEVECFFAAGMA